MTEGIFEQLREEMGSKKLLEKGKVCRVYKVVNHSVYELYLENDIYNCYTTVSIFNRVATRVAGRTLDDFLGEISEIRVDSQVIQDVSIEIMELIVSRYFASNKIGLEILTAVDKIYPTKRQCYQQLEQYLLRDTTNYGCILFGTRRTGKTVMMLQAMQQMKALGRNAVYVRAIKNEITGIMLGAYITALFDFGYDCIFVDELTYVSEDLEMTVSMVEAIDGHKLVISATDSLALRQLETGSLYDRCVRIDTTFIPYRDFAEVRNASSILEYIELGGVLDNNAVYSNKSVASQNKEYVNTAVVENIVGCFERCETRRLAPSIGALEENQIRTLIYKWTERYAANIVLSVLNKKITVQALSLALRNTVKKPTRELEQFKQEIITAFKEKCNLVEYDRYTQQQMEELECLLEMMGCLVRTGDNTKILIPIALKYGFILDLIEVLRGCTLDISASGIDIQSIIDNTIANVQGLLIEEHVRYELYTKGKYKCKYRNAVSGAEIDIIDMENNFYEVKRTKEIDLPQVRWLRNSEIQALNPNTLNVLYRGNIQTLDIDGLEIRYLNIEEFLKSL